MMHLNCIAIDDEPRALDVISIFSEKVGYINLKKVFTNSSEAVSYIKDEDIDLIFLDLQMPNLSGIDFMKSVANPPMIVIVTAHHDYAVESYEYDVVDYLLKPILFPRFLKACEKAFNRKKNINIIQEEENHPDIKSARISIKSKNEIHRLKPEEILYIEGAQNYLFVHCDSKRIISLERMKNIMEELPEEYFVRVHKSFIVNLSHIEKIERHQLTIKDLKIPIGRNYSELLKRKIEGKA